ncbi:S-type pyocin domain-containing protein [Pseudomonas sp. AL03]|uniref:S-type pyocin domain-containing protein n=1 Tax=Pseudomonas sp. AL03 TaxID=3042230 RepID=UPI00249A4E62|nr:S-type pyocin domain-containing protein [Pseudomonas sp. AL03]MDI3271001.1 S-type pyocin domain-containing protein [Pseudomonas sp. AL03]
MQKPPVRPGPLIIETPIHTIGEAPDHMTPAPRTSNTSIPGPFGHGIPTYYQNQNVVKATTQALEQEYQTRSSQLPQSIEAELAATRLEGQTHPLPPIQSMVRELDALNKLTQRKATEFHSKTVTANAFYGGDPFNRHINEFMKKGSAIEKWPGPTGIAMQTLNQSLRAAIEVRLLSQTIQSLNQRTANLQHALSVMQAAEQARLAAEQEAQRVAAEQARIKAEANAEAQLQKLVQLEAQERARIAALNTALAEAEAKAEAAAQHFAAEQARLQAEMEQRIEQIQKQLQTERQSLETRRKVIDTATAVAQRQAQLANLKIQQRKERQAQERERQQARLAVEAEAQRQLEQARLLAQWREETEARWQSPTFANVGSMAAFGPAFTGTTGTFGVSPTTSLALRNALRAAISAAIAALATAAAPVLVGFAALLAPSRLGNGDLFSVSVPLSELAPDSTADLYELAAVGGEIDLPVRLGSRTIGNRVEIVVVATDGVTVPASVPVRLAYFDARKNVYVSGSTVSNGPVITWTPLVEPQDPSTDFPLIDTDLPIYEGATVTPDTGRIDPFPELDLYGFGGFITVFPIESGIPPTFTMFRDRRQDPGVASGAGQPVSGNWLGAASTGEGAPIPMQIADKFRGREFSSFKAFRRAFWKAVSADPELSSQLFQLSKIETKKGLAARADIADHVGKKRKYDLHHVIPISEGGAVYDIDNLRVLTPKQHIKTHSRKQEL